MKERIFTIIITLFSIVLFADGEQPTGSGTEEDPYQVSILENLLWISTNDSCWNDYFIQINNIDAQETSSWNNGDGFIPIGSEENPFTGYYDGQNFSIFNLHVTGQLILYSGLFGVIERAHVSNLGLESVEINGQGLVGGLVGLSFCRSFVSNCYSSGLVSGDYISIGGLVGCNMDSSLVVLCYSSCDVTGSGTSVGGLIGYNHLSTIMDSYSLGSVSGYQRVGGLVGYSFSSINQNSFSLGNVICSDDFAGGLMGYDAGSTVTNCFSHGSVSGISSIGGLIGWIHQSDNIDKCYSIGSVIGEGYIGGLIGHNFNSNVTNSFWDIQTSGQNLSSGGTGKLTSEMTEVVTYTSLNSDGLIDPWDFVGNPYDDISNLDLWDIDAEINNGYPRLLISQNVDTDDPLITDVTSSSYLISNYPNPFNPSTSIEIFLVKDCNIDLNVYNSRGQLVSKVFSGCKSKGNYTFLWDGKDNFDSLVSSGIYYFELNINNRNVDLRKGILLK